MRDLLMDQAWKLQPELQEFRRDLHRHPETGFDLNDTVAKVRANLMEMDYEPKDCGKAGLVALVGGKFIS